MYWKIRRFVSTVTRHGKRHICFQSMSLIWKRSSKYKCNIFLNYLEIFEDSIALGCGTYLKNKFDFFNQVVIILGKSIRNVATSTKFFFPRIKFINWIQKQYCLLLKLNCVFIYNQDFFIPFSLKSCPT